MHALSSFVKNTSEHIVQLWDRLSNFKTYCLILRHTSHTITAKTPVTRLHASSLMFCQDNQWARMSDFESCCSTLRHIVWCWVIFHTNSLPRSPWQDCMQALSCSVKTISEIECLTCRQAVQLRDILSGLETCLTQDHCQDACYKIACKLSHISSRQSMSQNVKFWDRLSNFETYCLILRDTPHKITAETPVRRLHASSLIFCQECQWADCLTVR